VIELKLPQHGMGMADGTIVAWKKSEGDRVSRGEVLAEVEAAKTTIEIEAPGDGVLARILVPEDENVPVHTVIALIDDQA